MGLLLLLFMASIVMIYFYGDYKKPANPIKVTTTTLFVGDSHIQKAINDSMLESSQNIALSAEPIKYSYFKIQQVLAENNTIHKIYLGFSYHSISRRVDDLIVSKVNNLDNSHIYFSFLSCKEKIKLLSDHRRMIVPYTQKIFQQATNNITFTNKNKNRYSDFWGGYINEFVNTKINLDQTKKRIGLYYYDDNQIIDFSSTNIYYLDKIISL